MNLYFFHSQSIIRQYLYIAEHPIEKDRKLLLSDAQSLEGRKELSKSKETQRALE